MSWRDIKDFRRNNFDALRLSLALLVIFSHSYPLTRGKDAHDPIGAISLGQVDGGYVAVNCFFTISGFLIAHSWISTASCRQYFQKRARRIVPGFMAAMLVMTVVAPLASRPWQSAFTARHLSEVAINTLTLSGYPGSDSIFVSNPFPNSLNGSMWTIQYEFLCYAGLAFAGFAGLVTRHRLTATIFLALVAFHFAVQISPGILLYRWNTAFGGTIALLLGRIEWWPRLAMFFWSGIAFYSWRLKIPHKQSLALLATLIILVGNFTSLLNIAMPFALTYLIFWLAFHPAIRFERFARYGDFSYGTYLYGFPIQQFLVYGFPSISPLALFLLAAPASLFAGVVSWYAIERPFVRSKNRRVADSTAGEFSSRVVAPTTSVELAVSKGFSDN